MKARHTVLTILFVTWIVSSVDRMAMSVALPYISSEFLLTPIQSGLLLSTFFAGYSLSQIPGGLLADRFGVRKVATAAMIWWSAFTAVTGAAAAFMQMCIIRFVFGLGEGVFPACAFKTVAVWFPQRERATANAVMLASNPLGVALSPLIVVAIMAAWGWRSVFFCLFAPGLLIALLFWKFIPDQPSDSPFVSRDELRKIDEGDAVADDRISKPRLFEVLKEPSIIQYFLVLFTFDIAFWGFTAWLPTYLVKVRGFSMVQMGLTASVPFFAGTVGSVVGGWASDRFFRHNRRLAIILTELIAALFLFLTFRATTVTMLVIDQAVAGFFLLAFFATFWALPMNSIPKRAMGLASGFINMAGQLAAFVSPLVMGVIVEASGGSYDVALTFLVLALLSSAAIVLTIPRSHAAPRARPILP